MHTKGKVKIMKCGGSKRKRRKEIPDYTTRIDHYEQISRERVT